ncbi:hypothetical protein [Mastigocoleus testarum]|uniref:Uncharacterized protein n=1 Tax=Mastigocoleus testarum BC008 TaxID=371196 RepID=A0A0V7ZY37_9CYAN|nr:hypothetical protein [Mastigocoleus testarum]KST69281.1 hypothetical protein BC008_03590 [Mastigocoleus testarum BC008]
MVSEFVSGTATAFDEVGKMSINNLLDKWSSLDKNVSESQLNFHFTNHLWNFLGFPAKRRTYGERCEVNPSIEGGLQPDFMIYDQYNKPLLVVETKRRVANIAKKTDGKFICSCKSNNLYREAVGYDDSAGNGINTNSL